MAARRIFAHAGLATKHSSPIGEPVHCKAGSTLQCRAQCEVRVFSLWESSTGGATKNSWSPSCSHYMYCKFVLQVAVMQSQTSRCSHATISRAITMYFQRMPCNDESYLPGINRYVQLQLEQRAHRSSSDGISV